MGEPRVPITDSGQISDRLLMNEGDETMSAGSGDSGEQVPERSDRRLATLVAGLVGLEAAALLVGAVALVVAAVMGTDQGSPAALISLAVIAAAIGAGLAFCARGVAQGRRWTRGPVLTWQLLQAGVGMPLSTSGAGGVGVPLLAIAIVVGVLIVGRHVITESSDRF